MRNEFVITVSERILRGKDTDSFSFLFPAGPLTEVRSLEGKRVMLPCEVAPPIPGDDIILVLFYRGALGTPIYR